MGDEHAAEAGWVAQLVAGLSAYFYSIGYDKKQFRQEVDAAVAHITGSA